MLDGGMLRDTMAFGFYTTDGVQSFLKTVCSPANLPKQIAQIAFRNNCSVDWAKIRGEKGTLNKEIDKCSQGQISTTRRLLMG